MWITTKLPGADNKITVFINCNIYEDNGALLGTVGVGLQIDSLQALIQEYENQYHVEAYLVDQAGLIEIASHYTGYEKVNFFSLFDYPEEIRQSLLIWNKGEAADSFWTTQGDKSSSEDYLITRYIPELNWHLVVRQDTGQADDRTAAGNAAFRNHHPVDHSLHPDCHHSRHPHF